MKPHCSICQDHHLLEEFRFLPCGHGFCMPSIERYAESRGRRLRTCPICREPFRSQDAHPVYIELLDTNASPSQFVASKEKSEQPRYSEAVLKQADYASERLSKMDVNISADTMKRAGMEIRKVVDGLDRPPCGVEALLSAIAEFWQRIIPVFSTVSAQKEELAALKNNLRGAESEKRELKEEIEEAQRLAANAVDVADQAGRTLAALREEKESLVKHMEAKTKQLKEQLAEKASEKNGLWNTILAHKEKEAKQKAKIEALRQQIKEHESTISTLRRIASCSSASTSVTGHPQRRQAHAQSFISDTQDLPLANSSIPQEYITFDSDSEMESLVTEPLRIPALFCTPPRSLPEPALPQRPKFATEWTLKPSESKAKRKRTGSVEKNPLLTNSFPSHWMIMAGQRGKFN